MGKDARGEIVDAGNRLPVTGYRVLEAGWLFHLPAYHFQALGT
ncbi:MAG: hypothetical protein ABFS05_00935 [Bacteroidota bacterium]